MAAASPEQITEHVREQSVMNFLEVKCQRTAHRLNKGWREQL
jgi:hypothetical protein